MNDSNTIQGLLSQDDQQTIPLKGMHVHAELQDLLSEVEIYQTFTNEENRAIEAVYTFPLPIDAVLLSFSVTIAEKLLIGVVQERKLAEKQYEDAISEGDNAILLQKIEAGLYTVNVGNLAENETVIITFRYAQLHRWSQDVLRWHLPTVLAPRYGNPKIAPHQVPDIDLTVEHVYTLKLSLKGLLSTASIESPSHAIEVRILDDATQIHLKQGKSFLDRDLILNLRLANDKVCAICDLDVDGYIALASFYPALPKPNNQNSSQTIKPRFIKLLVDCSGSMAGESIGQARLALLNILDSLNEHDRFLLICFGDDIEVEISTPLQATQANIIKGRNIVAKIDANLGGTEIFSAIEKTIKFATAMESADILLITDGEVWDESGEHSKTQGIIDLANQNRHRIFTVGVGSSVSERFVREIAENTQAACELVNPGEGMADKIERHFKRIYAEQAESIKIEWPFEPVWQTEIKHFFVGDTLNIFAKFQEKPEGTVKLTANFADGSCIEQLAGIKSLAMADELNVLARLAASQRLRNLDFEEKVELAVNYQLMCEETAYLVVDVKSEDLKTDGMPDLRKVPHMLASGWGGFGQSDNYGTISYDMCDYISYDMSGSYTESSNDSNSIFDLSKEENLVLRGDKMHESEDWIYLPFPDDINEYEVELSIDGISVRKIELMQVKKTSKLEIRLNNINIKFLSNFTENTLLDTLLIVCVYNEINDHDLFSLVHLKYLKEIYLYGCYKITDFGLELISRLPNLESISLGSSDNITDVGIDLLSKLPKLKSVSFSSCNSITDVGIDLLSKVPNLEQIFFDGCNGITDNGLVFIENYQKIKNVTFINCDKITKQGIDKLPAELKINSGWDVFI